MEDRHIKAFKEESYDILGELEALLLELEENPRDAGLIDRVFGTMHTIKGSGAMFGFDAVSEFTHEIETVLDMVRDGILPVTSGLIRLTLSARDKILEMLDSGTQSLDEEALAIVAGFRKMVEVEEPEKKEETTAFPSGEPAVLNTYRILFKPRSDIFATGTNPLLLLAELRAMGESAIVVQTDAIPLLADYDPEACYVSWEIVLTTALDENAIRDVFIFIEDDCELIITRIFEHDPTMECENYRRLGEILLDRGELTPEVLETFLGRHKPLGEQLVEAKVVLPEKIEAALSEQEHVRQVLQRDRDRKASSLRVDAARLDSLVDLVGELVTVQARLSQKAAGGNDPELQLIAESVERLTEELRDNAMSIRMVPIGTLFSRFRRLVHDLAGELGKQVQIITEGAATELDKTVIDQLNEPLVHIIRNAIDHGIEPPSQREALGKSTKGTIYLAAEHAGASVVISISDDGAGLDPEKLKAKAVEKGIINQDDDLSDEECYALILRPGFSTSAEVTGVSGRGVGMDVVKRSIDSLRGTIGISSRPGQGMTVSLRLPLTLAIIDGLLVSIGQGLFVIPLSVIDECVELSRDEAARSRERSMMTFRGEALPYVSLRAALGIEGDPPDIEKVVLVNAMGKKTGFSVDQVIGQHQTVIKTLSRVYGNVEGISGATILGDGTVALILDVNQLVMAERSDSQRKSQIIGLRRAETVS
ncbi:MAG: chemotaxis protein CheA [Desulfobulbus sp.]|nr:MAG: chemotaxis protein CheA [Desulfobulbus sp.]